MPSTIVGKELENVVDSLLFRFFYLVLFEEEAAACLATKKECAV